MQYYDDEKHEVFVIIDIWPQGHGMLMSELCDILVYKLYNVKAQHILLPDNLRKANLPDSQVNFGKVLISAL